MNEHQWWCGGKDPCACTEAWKSITWPNDLIALKWAETLSTGEQSVLLAANLKYLQARIDAALTKAIADERARCAGIVNNARFEGEQDLRSLVHLIRNPDRRDDTADTEGEGR